MSFPSSGMSVPRSTEASSFSATGAVTGSDTPSISSFTAARGYVTTSPWAHLSRTVASATNLSLGTRS